MLYPLGEVAPDVREVHRLHSVRVLLSWAAHGPEGWLGALAGEERWAACVFQLFSSVAFTYVANHSLVLSLQGGGHIANMITVSEKKNQWVCPRTCTWMHAQWAVHSLEYVAHVHAIPPVVSEGS